MANNENDLILTKLTITLGKNRRGTLQREGYRAGNGLVFMPPKSGKRVSAWKKKMEDRGYLVG